MDFFHMQSHRDGVGQSPPPGDGEFPFFTAPFGVTSRVLGRARQRGQYGDMGWSEGAQGPSLYPSGAHSPSTPLCALRATSALRETDVFAADCRCWRRLGTLLLSEKSCGEGFEIGLEWSAGVGVPTSLFGLLPDLVSVILVCTVE